MGTRGLHGEICRGERANLLLVSLSGMAEGKGSGQPRRSGWGVMAGAERDPRDLRGEPAGWGRRRKGWGCRGRVMEEPAARPVPEVVGGGRVVQKLGWPALQVCLGL